MEQRNGGSGLVNGAAQKTPRGSWTKDQKRQIVAESQVPGANLAEVAQRHCVRVALVSSWRRQWVRSGKGTARLAKISSVKPFVRMSIGCVLCTTMLKPGELPCPCRVLSSS